MPTRSAPTEPTELKIEFEFEKETKNTVRYKESGDKTDHAIGILYVQKTVYEKLGSPKSIEVVIRPT